MHIVDFGKNFDEEAYMTLFSTKKIIDGGQERVLESRSHLAPIVYLQTDQAPQ